MTEAATKWVGQVIDGKFRLGEYVGGDEGSSVFLTDYDSPDVRKAAIKLVPADAPEAAGLLARWRHAAKLSHPHMIRLLDTGRAELDGAAVLYVVMEYAEENLSAVIARRPLAPDEARAILGPVVDALAYVHAKGFVHCRIKPTNIMAENDLLKISSDGLCRIGEFSGSVGKPGAYDPPEAAGGRISPAGDVWSLGMTLCEALTQRLPVWERTNQAEPALPSNLPAEFLDLARHCLRRDPQLRWSVADIAVRLLPNAPTPPKQIARGAQHFSAHRSWVGTAAPIGLALLAILAAARVFQHHSQTEPTHAAAGAELSAQPGVQPKVQPRIQPSAQPKPEKKPVAAAVAAPVAKPAPPVAPPARREACGTFRGTAQPEEPCGKRCGSHARSGAAQDSSARATSDSSGSEQRHGARKSRAAVFAGRLAKVAGHDSRKGPGQRDSPRGRIRPRDGSGVRCSRTQPIFRRPHAGSRKTLVIRAGEEGRPQRAQRMGAAFRDRSERNQRLSRANGSVIARPRAALRYFLRADSSMSHAASGRSRKSLNSPAPRSHRPPSITTHSPFT